MALLDNYGLQLTEDRRTHISRITTKDPTAPPPLTTRVIQLKYASTSNMVDSIQASLTDKRSKVLPDSRTSQLVIVATENEQEALDSLINQLDKPTRQVLIETKLVQISSNPSTTKGVDWSGTLAAQHVTFGNGFQSGSTLAQIPGAPVTTTTTFGGNTVSTTTTPSSSQATTLNISGEGNGGFSWNTFSGLTPGIGFLSADGASAVIHFLNATYDAQITSTPRIVTLDNQMATIEVSRTYPIINMAGGTANSGGSSSVTYSNVGTILQVTPRISANDYIWMKVIPSVHNNLLSTCIFSWLSWLIANGGAALQARSGNRRIHWPTGPPAASGRRTRGLRSPRHPAGSSSARVFGLPPGPVITPGRSGPRR